eukprot:gnl/Ergobibamus_cyprinoides/2745.p1 GENE.gnl/Ergobibamus_cyprinoides/2745~~gnl/Ergobibamus_cyprinoides/2745.p1  ORF type:complete len:111 (+),score=65.43 gnl/Ergobibamus_cyprinoides/2745:22-333(+)
MSSTEELACVYASLILADEGLPVTAEKINALVEAAGVKVAAYWPGLFAQYLAGKDINEMLTASSTAAPAAAAAGPAAAAAEEAKEESEEESGSDSDMGFGGLF